MRRLGTLELRARFGLGGGSMLASIRHDLPETVRVTAEWTGEAPRPLPVAELGPDERRRIGDALLHTYFACLRPREALFVDFRLEAFASTDDFNRLRWAPRLAWYRIGDGLRDTLLALYATHFAHRVETVPLEHASTSLLSDPRTDRPRNPGPGGLDGSEHFCGHLPNSLAPVPRGALAAAFDGLAAVARAHDAMLRPDLTVLSVALATLHESLVTLGSEHDAAALFREIYP